MKYADGSIKKYLGDLAARVPAPGGGSAAALIGGIAASLIIMTCRYTLGKEKYKKYEARVKDILAQSMKTQKRLNVLVDEDVEAYRQKDAEKSISVPAQVCALSCALMTYADELLTRGNKNLMTDAGLAVLLAEAGFLAGLSYVKVNITCCQKKTEKHKQLLRSLEKMSRKVRRIRQKAEVRVGYLSRR
jgi:glutamate formiminotransferase/formiminotetrahydrofolate cyclodeaminase